MSRKTGTLPPEYFEEKYRADIDPWQFRTSNYEHEKYVATISALGQSRYISALEIGCSIGVLTELLAGLTRGRDNDALHRIQDGVGNRHRRGARREYPECHF